MLPLFGSEGVVLIVISALLISVVNLVELDKNKKIFVCAMFLSCILLNPSGIYYKLSDGYDTAAYPFDVIEDEVGVLSLYKGGFSKFIKARLNRSPTANIVHNVSYLSWNRMNLSYLKIINPDFSPKRVLIIGLGSSNFIYGLSKTKELEKIVVAEISPAVVAATYKYADKEIVDFINSDKVELLQIDGRRLMKIMESNEEKFDVVQIGTFQPKASGSSNLYSADLFKVAKSLLNPNGVFITLDYAGVVRAGFEGFDYGWSAGENFSTSGYSFFTDWNPLKDVNSCYEVEKSLWVSAFSKTPNQNLKITEVPSLFDLAIYNKRDFDNIPVNTDNNPVMEYRMWRILNKETNMITRVSRDKKINRYRKVSIVKCN